MGRSATTLRRWRPAVRFVASDTTFRRKEAVAQAGGLRRDRKFTLE